MEIGIGLPAAVEGIDGPTLIEWARRSERYPFAVLSALDRIVFPNYEPFVTLAAAAAVTTRVRLITAILLAPVRTNTALLAKQAATLDNLSNGRLVLGVAVGRREDDYAASRVDFHRRGRMLDRQLDELRAIWRGEGGIGPKPFRESGPEIMIGGHSPATIRRIVRAGDGWIHGGGGPQALMDVAKPLLAAWQEAGRSGRPRLQAGMRFGLGKNGRALVEAQARNYYSSMPAAAIEKMVEESATDVEAVKDAVRAFEVAGCDELMFTASSTDPMQVDLLAKAIF